MSTRPLALVTGASSGIGRDIATELARTGHDLVLVARREPELAALASQLSASHGIVATSLVADLANPAGVDGLMAALEQRALAVDVLVNNAGFAQFGEFITTDARAEADMLQLNMVTLTTLMKRLLPGMVQRGRGRVLNVASTAAFMPGPLMAAYYATKAYVLSLSEAVAEELAGTGVTVTALCPGPTASGFQDRAAMHDSKLVKGKAIMPSAEVARTAVEAMQAGRRVVIPGLMNRIQALIPRFLPRRVVPALVRRAQAVD